MKDVLIVVYKSSGTVSYIRFVRNLGEYKFYPLPIPASIRRLRRLLQQNIRRYDVIKEEDASHMMLHFEGKS